MFWLLQQMFVLETYLWPVTLQVIVPSVLMIGQYLQLFVFQHFLDLPYLFSPSLKEELVKRSLSYGQYIL